MKSTFNSFIPTCLPRPSDQMPSDFSTRIRVPRYYATEFNKRREGAGYIERVIAPRAHSHAYFPIPIPHIWCP